MQSVTKKIYNYNIGRDKNLLKFKYAALTESPHRFFRGTCHLFNSYLSASLMKDPKVWCCGDMHLENFGSYKGENRLIYFDINDFDEATVAPCTVDLIRLCVSIFLSGGDLNLPVNERKKLCEIFLKSYKTTIQSRHASRIEAPIATGIIKNFLDKLARRKRKTFIKKRTKVKKRKTFIKTDGIKYLPLNQNEKETVKTALKNWVKENKKDEHFFKFIDAAIRIAGTGSLGLKRYCILIEGKGYANHYLLDFKEAAPSSLQDHFHIKQVAYSSEAQRVVQAQKLMQDTSAAHLSVTEIKKTFYIVKEHQPSEDKFDVSRFKKDIPSFENLNKQLGKIVAWAQLRSSGRDKTATADELLRFVNSSKWQEEVCDQARKIYFQTMKDYKDYVKDYRKK